MNFELRASSKGMHGRSIPVEEQARFREQTVGQCSWSVLNYMGDEYKKEQERAGPDHTWSPTPCCSGVLDKLCDYVRNQLIHRSSQE